MTAFHCVPIYLHAFNRIQFNQCTVIPGVTIKKFDGKVSQLIKKFSERQPQRLQVSPNFLVFIDENKYFEKLSLRLAKEGKSLPRHRYLESIPLAKQAIMALILAGRVSFSMHGVFSLEKTGRQYRITSFSNTEYFNIHQGNASALLSKTGLWPPIDPKAVAFYGKLLDRYYRSGTWWLDRYSMALAHFWTALCTQFPDQTLIGMTSTLECLLSTKNIEITHTLSERTALLLHKTPKDRVNKYYQVKNIYNMRSKLVHGKAFPKRGNVNIESLYISPKLINVPRSFLEDTVDLTVNILLKVINNKNLMSIIQKKGSEDKITTELDKYFISILFNAS